MKKLLLILTMAFAATALNAQQTINGVQMEKAIANPQAQIIDVRTPSEFEKGHIPNAQNFDWKNQTAFQQQMEQLNQDEPVYIYCLSGGRSEQAESLLTEQGFTVYDYSGGMMDWRRFDGPEVSNQKHLSSLGLSTEEYDRITASSDLVLVNFSTDWCAPCQELKPVLDQIENEHADTIKLVRLDADENKSLTRVLNVTELPQILLYHQGELLWAHEGLIDKNEILQQAEKTN